MVLINLIHICWNVRGAALRSVAQLPRNALLFSLRSSRAATFAKGIIASPLPQFAVTKANQRECSVSNEGNGVSQLSVPQRGDDSARNTRSQDNRALGLLFCNYFRRHGGRTSTSKCVQRLVSMRTDDRPHTRRLEDQSDSLCLSPLQLVRPVVSLLLKNMIGVP